MTNKQFLEPYFVKYQGINQKAKSIYVVDFHFI